MRPHDMTLPQVLLTGFEPFLDVRLNPSGELARRLHGRSLAGARIHGAVLPVAFGRVGAAYAAALEALGPDPPLALLSLGVHGGSGFKLEERARPVLSSTKLDNDGRRAEALTPLGERELRSGLDFGALGAALERGGARGVARSRDAGGFVCERCYWEVLSSAQRLSVPGLFLHVPPVEEATVEEQLPVVEALIVELLRQAATQ
jgi:pyroglutamyl-peptidase